MTKANLDRANELQAQVEQFKSARQNNFQIKIENWSGGNIEDKDLRPETQAQIKQLLIDEAEYLQSEFDKM